MAESNLNRESAVNQLGVTANQRGEAAVIIRAESNDSRLIWL